MRKRYQALVHGCWSAAPAGEIDLPMTVEGPKQRVDHAAGRPSLTRYRVLEVDVARGVSRIELEPVTGRSHQLRVHLEAMGHPIIGDDFYGTPASCAKADRLMLHACAIELVEPVTGRVLWIECAAPF